MRAITDIPMRAHSALQPLISFAWQLVAALAVARVLLVAWQWERVSAADMLLPILVQGLRFDLVVLGLILTIPVLSFPLLASNRYLFGIWRLLLAVYLPAMLLLAIFMELSTPSFVSQFDSRPNILFFEYLEHPREVVATLWAAYRLPLFIAAIVLSGTGFAVSRRMRRIVGRASPTGLLPAIVLTPLLLVLCFGLIRSTTDHRPVNPSTVALSGDPLVNDLALNSMYTALYALYETRHESAGGFRYTRLDDLAVIAEVRAGMQATGGIFTAGELPTMHWQEPPRVLDQSRNLVIIVEESLGAEFVGALGGLDLTPNLDALSVEGLWFERLYATGTRSVRGLEAIVSGFTPTPARSVVKLPKSQRNFFTLAGLLRRAGYETAFIYGGEAQFDNMRRFFMNNGFDKVIDEKDYKDPVYTGSWGVSDEDLFDRAHEEFSAARGKPFFSLVFTSSNHSPYQFPDGRIELYDADKNTVNNAVKYADHALGQFIRKARQSEYWDDTVFLIVADHNSRVYGSELVPVERFHVPGLILGGSIEPGRFAAVASQIDLAPTLLSLIGVAGEHPMIGHDLTRADAQRGPGRAIMQFNATQAYMEGDRVVVLQKDLAPQLFRFSDGRLHPSDIPDEHLERKALAHSAWPSIAYEQSLYRLPDREERAQQVAAASGSK